MADDPPDPAAQAGDIGRDCPVSGTAPVGKGGPEWYVVQRQRAEMAGRYFETVMKRRYCIPLIAATLAAVLTSAQPAATQQLVERIAAVVNDEVISTSDIEARLRLDMLASGLQPSPQNQQRLMPGVLRTLINERIQLQEAGRFNIEVADNDLAQAIGNIAGQNGLSAAGMRDMLASNGIPISTLEDRLRSNIAWTRLTQRRFATSIDIGNEDVEEVIEQYRSNQGLPEYLLAEIFLAVDAPQDEQSVRQLAEQLADQIRQGAAFPSVARQFSQSGGAANGGDVGWVIQGQLDPSLDAVLTQIPPGQISPPVRSPTGYHILYVRDRRRVAEASPDDVVATLYRLAIGIPAGSTLSQAQPAIDTVEEASRSIRGCDALAARAEELGAGNIVDAGRGPVGQLPPAIRAEVAGLPDGVPTRAIRLPDGVVMFMLCDREQSNTGLPSRESIVEALSLEKLTLMRRRYLRDLRNAAYIELRV